MSDLIKQGAYGAVVGATVGAPLKGQRLYRKISFYDPIPVRMAASDTLDAWAAFSGHLSSGGTIDGIGQALADNWSSWTEETAFGLANINAGIPAPMSGAHRNPLGGGSRAFGRAAYWGLAFHGRPDEAAEWAFRDASMDHSEAGAWLPAAVARMIACAQPGRSVSWVLRAGTAVIPKGCRSLAALPMLLDCAASFDGASKARNSLPIQFAFRSESEAFATFSWIVTALVIGDGAFDKTVLAAASLGGEADQVGICAGVLGALLSGETPDEWLKPLGRNYAASTSLRNIDPPPTIKQWRRAG
jgi:hypothetical protein